MSRLFPEPYCVDSDWPEYGLKIVTFTQYFYKFVDLKFSLIPTVDYVDSGWPEYGLSTGGCHSGTY